MSGAGPRHVLEGYRVLDFSQVVAGPTTTRLMAEMGAEVIKVELLPGGDISRSLPFLRDGRSAYFVQQNRGKQSLAVNHRSAEGRQILARLVGAVDVVIENFAPGAMARMGLDWPQVRELNPRAVMCSISAFGQSGPLASLPGYDYIAQAYAGVTYMTGDPEAAPCFSIIALGDVSTGVYALAGITAALLHRERSGRGQYLDLALLDAYLNGHEVNVQAYSASRGAIRPRRSGSHHYAVAPLGIYAGTSGYFFIVALPHQWPGFCQALGMPELASDPRFETPEKRVAHLAELTHLIETWLQSFGDDEAARKRLEAARVPVAPVLSIEQIVEHPHHRERRSIRTVHDRVLGDFDVPGMPLRFSDFPEELPLEAPFLGEHNLAVLSRHLGLSIDEVAALERAGVLGRERV